MSQYDEQLLEWAQELHTGTQNHTQTQHLTVDDLYSWLSNDGDGDVEKTEDAINDLMGTQTVEFYESVDRLPWAVQYRLGIPLPVSNVVGGVDVTLSFD